MSFFGKKPTPKKIVAVLDIGSASVGGALVSIPEQNSHEKPEILFATRQPLYYQNELNFETFLAAMLQSLDTVLGKLRESGEGIPSRVHTILAAPWYASQTRIVKYAKNVDFVFSDKLWSELVEKESRAFEEVFLKQYSEMGDKARIIEGKNINILLNGYPSKDPIGKKTREVELSLYLSISSEEVTTNIEERINTVFKSPITFSSFLFNLFAVARDIFPNESNFIVADIGGEVTDVGVAKNDVLLDTASFPYGTNMLARTLSSKLDLSKHETSAYLHLYMEGKLEKRMHARVDRVLEKVRKEWLMQFAKTLDAMSKDLSLPSTIFLTTDEEILQWFGDTALREEFAQYTHTNRPFSVILVNKRVLAPYLLVDGGVRRDLFLMLETLFINKHHR